MWLDKQVQLAFAAVILFEIADINQELHNTDLLICCTLLKLNIKYLFL
jgi:hypothetical protein